MKEITRVSLAALPYNIEIEAKKELEKYLRAVEQSLGADRDTMKEIEARIAELLAEHDVYGEKVVSSADITMITAQLGEPKEFIADTATVSAESTKKRLMRDTSNELLGGVCSGLAAYANIDTVWVRLGWVLLTLVTSGFMILVYIVLWIVMPPARTAADRLQMKGRPVTLEALQQESEVLPIKKETDRQIFTALRILGGIIVTGLGILALVAVVFASWTVFAQHGADVKGWDRLAYILMAAAGILFTIGAWISAYMLFAARKSQRLFVILVSIAILGIGLFVSGATLAAVGVRTRDTRMEAEMSRSARHTPLDATAIKGAKRLVLRSELPISVNYNVDPSHTEATLWYNAALTKMTPQVALATDQDGTLTVNVPTAGNHCLPEVERCRNQITVTIVGPALESVDASGSNLVRYSVQSQDKLVVSTRADGHVETQSTGTINQLQATLSNESWVDFTAAGITHLDLTVEDALSNADIATVDSLAITVPTACAANHGGGIITIDRARLITVNGQPYSAGAEYPCATVELRSAA